VTPSPQKKKKQLVVTPKKKKKVEKMVGKKVEKEAGGHTRCSLKIVFAHASYVCLRV
jgi:hypothetical protein